METNDLAAFLAGEKSPASGPAPAESPRVEPTPPNRGAGAKVSDTLSFLSMEQSDPRGPVKGQTGSVVEDRKETKMVSAPATGLALRRAALNGHWAALEELLRAGGDPDAGDPSAYGDVPPPLLGAALANTRCVKALLQAGADPKVTDNAGRTALHQAASKDNLEVARLLLAAGLDANVTAKDGLRPLDLARSDAMRRLLQPIPPPAPAPPKDPAPIHAPAKDPAPIHAPASAPAPASNPAAVPVDTPANDPTADSSRAEGDNEQPSMTVEEEAQQPTGILDTLYSYCTIL